MAGIEQGPDDARPGGDRRKFIAGTAAAGAAAWVAPTVARTHLASADGTPPPSTTTTTEPPPPPPDTCDLNNWSMIRSGGTWTVAGDGNSVFQTSNGSPTFFASPDDLTGFTFDLFIEVESTGDDDIIGFLVGLTKPVDTIDTEQDYLVFSWKQGDQNFSGRFSEEGMSLARVVGDADVEELKFWDHQIERLPEWDVLATNVGDGTGWGDNQQYAFRVQYTTGAGGNIKVFRKTTDGNVFPALTDADKVFDVDGNFPAGRIAFYNYSQPNVRYILANC